MNYTFASYADLEAFDKVSFTPREIDVLACIALGRRAKAIAHCLNISERTVNTHTSNMMKKLGCNATSQIQDFIQKSKKTELFRAHYQYLWTRSEFKKALKGLAVLLKRDPPNCSIVYEGERARSSSLVSRILENLKDGGLLALDKKETPQTKDGHIKLCFTHTKDVPSLKDAFEERAIYIYVGDETPDQISLLPNPELISFSKQENYCLSFLEIFKKTNLGERFPEKLPEKLKELEDQFKNVQGAFKEEEISPTVRVDKHSILLKLLKLIPINEIPKKLKPYFVVASLLLVVFANAVFFFYWETSPAQNMVKEVRSSLIIPADSALLKRLSLITEMEKIFKAVDTSKTVTLVGIVGMGGVGKTTLARMYGKAHPTSVVYEINGETRTTLLVSFKDLASALAHNGTKAHQNEFSIIENIQKAEEKEKEVLAFVQARLKERCNWILIYDNVDTLTDIKDYLPQNLDIWGAGKVILTTCNSNLRNSTSIKPENIINLDALTDEEAFTLFTKIYNESDTARTPVENSEEVRVFLQHIPPFPLDISIAASYLRATNLSFKSYLDELKEDNPDFESLQKKLLKENSDYNKTRSSIIIQSLEQLVATHPEFKGLIVMMGLLDSQNMPRELFDKYKDKTVVDNFLFQLQKYSFVTLSTLEAVGNIKVLSIHRSTQEITFEHLKRSLKLDQNNPFLHEISDLLEAYMEAAIEGENFEKINYFIPHIEALLKRAELVNNEIEGPLQGVIGGGYNLLGNYEKARISLETSLTLLRKNPENERYRIARVLYFLGEANSQIVSDYEKAKTLFQESLQIYKAYFPEKHIEIAQVLVKLGWMNEELSQFEKARVILEEAYDIYQKDDPENHVKFAMVQSHLGETYRRTGEYQKAKENHEKSLAIYEKYCPEKKHIVARAHIWLGKAYKNLGNFEKARKHFEVGVTLFKECYGDRMMRVAMPLVKVYRLRGEYKKAIALWEEISASYKKYQYPDAWPSVCYADIARDLGDYERARELLEYGFNQYQKMFDENNLYIGMIYVQLGHTYLGLERYVAAKIVTEKGLAIYRSYFQEDSQKIARISSLLAMIEIKLGNYDKAHALLDKSLAVYEKVYGKKHDETARLLRVFGQLYLAQGDLDKAENFFIKSYRILEYHQHPNRYLCLEDLGDLLITRADIKTLKPDAIAALKKRAFDYYRRALRVGKIFLPEDAPRLKTLEKKLNL